MTALAIGVGCRAGCAASAIVNLVTRAWDDAGRHRPAVLFTVVDKAAEPGLLVAATLLGLDLTGLPRAALAAVAARTVTLSPGSAALFGVPSVAEASALAGAGLDAVLLLSRRSEGGATCAVAGEREGSR